MNRTLTETESNFVAFADYVIRENVRAAGAAMACQQKGLAQELLTVAEVAGKKKRELLGLPEPDPDVDYDDDYHADGTKRIDGEPRREKGESFSDRLDLSALRQGDSDNG